MQNRSRNEAVRRATVMFKQGMFPGAVAGAVIGLAPGILLILVLTGDSYHIGGAEVLGFVIMSLAACTLIGTAIGGYCSVIIRTAKRSLVSRGILRG